MYTHSCFNKPNNIEIKTDNKQKWKVEVYKEELGRYEMSNYLTFLAEFNTEYCPFCGGKLIGIDL